ncbi:MAG: hypothetical protein RLY93_08810, partial [Sumerlaeia bacterium]
MKTFATIALVAFCSRWCIAAGFHYLLEGHADPSAPVIERRGRGTASGEVLHPAGLILPADRLFREFVLDAETLQVGYADFVSPAVGLSMELPTFDLGPDPWGDADVLAHATQAVAIGVAPRVRTQIERRQLHAEADGWRDEVGVPDLKRLRIQHELA